MNDATAFALLVNLYRAGDLDGLFALCRGYLTERNIYHCHLTCIRDQAGDAVSPRYLATVALEQGAALEGKDFRWATLPAVDA